MKNDPVFLATSLTKLRKIIEHPELLELANVLSESISLGVAPFTMTEVKGICDLLESDLKRLGYNPGRTAAEAQALRVHG